MGVGVDERPHPLPRRPGCVVQPHRPSARQRHLLQGQVGEALRQEGHQGRQVPPPRRQHRLRALHARLRHTQHCLPRRLQGAPAPLRGRAPPLAAPASADAGADLLDVCLLPDARDGLWRLTDKIACNPEFVREHLPTSKVQAGDFRLPKFKASFGMSMNDVLRDMGVKEAFELGKADLSDMHGGGRCKEEAGAGAGDPQGRHRGERGRYRGYGGHLHDGLRMRREPSAACGLCC
uniref:Serpin domain-containing protein n=1 Tax=Triticum urartu TaxID=4572 RepID=A0A8R7P9A2_TRIUA